MISLIKNKETKKFLTYAILGVGLTAFTYILWSIGVFILETSLNNSPENISIAYFISSFLVIGLSLFLNRKITFKEDKRAHDSKLMTILIYYSTYGLSAFIASIFSLIAINILPSFVPLFFIQLFTIGINTILNYLSQRFIIFKVKK